MPEYPLAELGIAAAAAVAACAALRCGSSGKTPAGAVLITRHAERVDYATRLKGGNWQASAERPWDTPITAGGVLQAEALGKATELDAGGGGVGVEVIVVWRPLRRGLLAPLPDDGVGGGSANLIVVGGLVDFVNHVDPLVLAFVGSAILLGVCIPRAGHKSQRPILVGVLGAAWFGFVDFEAHKVAGLVDRALEPLAPLGTCQDVVQHLFVFVGGDFVGVRTPMSRLSGAGRLPPRSRGTSGSSRIHRIIIYCSILL
eukprot:COSAG05_NODE_2202_length_3405_cov_29.546884_2_plen_258_part_00